MVIDYLGWSGGMGCYDGLETCSTLLRVTLPCYCATPPTPSQEGAPIATPLPSRGTTTSGCGSDDYFHTTTTWEYVAAAPTPSHPTTITH